MGEAQKRELDLAVPNVPKKFSGEVLTIVPKPHEGFADYSVATLTIEKGVLTKIELSDPYAGFEALMKLEIANAKAFEKMRSSYPPEFRHV